MDSNIYGGTLGQLKEFLSAWLYTSVKEALLCNCQNIISMLFQNQMSYLADSYFASLKWLVSSILEELPRNLKG